MKQLFMALIFGLYLFSMFSCSENSTEPGDKAILGKWFAVKSVNIEEDDYDEINYNPELDQYYSAEFMEVKSEEMLIYLNGSGPGYMVFSIKYQRLSEGRLEIKINYDSRILTDTVSYYFEDDLLVLENQEDYYGFTEITKTFYQKYTGDIPPSSWTSALENDDYEPDNNSDEANMIVVNAQVQYHVITSGDQDWYTFNAMKDSTYLIAVTGYMDNVLTLLNSDLSQIAEDDDNEYDVDIDNAQVESAIIWTCDTTGTYFVRVTGWDDEFDVGYYGVSVSYTDLEVSQIVLDKNSKSQETNKNVPSIISQTIKRR